MSNKYKTGLLAALLLGPVFLFLFLKFFGKNHFEVANFANNEKYLKDESGGVYHVPDFSLRNQDGNFITGRSLDGKIRIVDFIFTRCKGICPRMTTQLTRVYDAFEKNNDVVLLSHTVDPEFDSIPVLAAYAKSYGASTPRWNFFGGTKEVLYPLARMGYKLAVADSSVATDDKFVHSDKVVLVDKKGRIRGFYSGTDPLKIDTLILETKILLEENE